MFYRKVLNDFLFFFFLLFAVGSTFSIALAQSALGISLVLFIFAIILKRYNPFIPDLKWFYIPVFLYIAWMIISSLMGDTPLRSVKIIKEEWLFLAVPIGVYVLYRENFRKALIYGFAGAVLLVSIYGLIQHFTGVYWFKDTPPYEAFNFGYRVKGFFAHRLTFGNYYATASIFILCYSWYNFKKLSLNQRWFFLTSGILSFVVTLLSYSYGPIIAVVAVVLVFILVKTKLRGQVVLVASLITFFILIFSTPGLRERVVEKIEKETNVENQASRFYIWDNSFEMIKENPLFGVGQGNFIDQFKKIRPDQRVHVHAHNDLINIAALGGIPGMLFYVAIWIGLFKLGQNSKTPEAKAALWASAAFLVTSLTEATFADEEVRQMLMLIWAIGLFEFYPKMEPKIDSNVKALDK